MIVPAALGCQNRKKLVYSLVQVIIDNDIINVGITRNISPLALIIVNIAVKTDAVPIVMEGPSK